jgi:hypothetical protein
MIENRKSQYEFHGLPGLPAQRNTSDMVQIEQSRALSKVQVSAIMAKRFPRDINQAFSKIIDSCKRKSLAEKAIYGYPRGGSVVTGPSIRLAEVIAQNWGNMSFGIREISQSDGVSVVQAFAIDLENNVEEIKEFQVPHKRYTKSGSYDLKDPRDIYELVANQGARRLRACILAVIPGDITEAAEEQCRKTQKEGNSEPIEDRVRKLVIAFNEMGIKVNHLEEKLGHKLESVTEDEIVSLRSIFRSLKDNIVRREDFFNLSQQEENKKQEETNTSSLIKKLSTKKNDIKNEPLQEQKEPITTQEEIPKISKEFFGEEEINQQ